MCRSWQSNFLCLCSVKASRWASWLCLIFSTPRWEVCSCFNLSDVIHAGTTILSPLNMILSLMYSLCRIPQNGSTWLGHSLQQTGQPVFIICQSATSWGSSLDWFRISCSFESLTRSLKKHMYLNKRVQIYNCIFFIYFLKDVQTIKSIFQGVGICPIEQLGNGICPIE
jgi:hypothetical protein